MRLPDPVMAQQGSCQFCPMASSPTPSSPHIDSTSDQVLKIYLSLTEKKNIVHTVKQNHTKDGYFSFFNPLKVTGKLEIESLGQVHGDEQGRGELTRGETGIIPQQY